jgi:hypothetical protein
MILSNENQVAVHLSKSDILRQGDVYNVQVTACNAASLCKTAWVRCALFAEVVFGTM